MMQNYALYIESFFILFYFIALTSGGSFFILTLPDFTWPTFVGKKDLNQNNKKKKTSSATKDRAILPRLMGRG